MTESNLQRNQELNLHENERSVAAENQNSSIGRIVYIVYFLFSVVELLLGLRVVLHVVGVHPDNGFANFIYALSSPLLALFASPLKDPAPSTTPGLQVTTLIPMMIY